jgi:hypothetical protein
VERAVEVVAVSIVLAVETAPLIQQTLDWLLMVVALAETTAQTLPELQADQVAAMAMIQ